MQKEPIKIMKSSSSDSNKQVDRSKLIPQFVSAIYIKNGEIVITYQIMDGFPKNLILSGLATMAQEVKTNLIDHIIPGAEQDTAMATLEDLAEDGKTAPHKAKVLTLDIKPTEEEG